MTGLPQFLRRLPYVFYALAGLLFAWELANQWASLNQSLQYAGPGNEAISALGKSMALKAAIENAAFMVANGAIVQALIAIYEKGKVA